MSDYNGLTYRANGITYSKALTQEQLLHRLVELEGKIESGEFGDIAVYKHRIEVLERAFKRVINEYTCDGEITVSGCEECDIAFGHPIAQCLQNQFNRLLKQAEKELYEEK